MKKKLLNFPVYLVLFSLSVLWLLPNSTMAEGDGAWTTPANPGYIFQTEEDLVNNKKHLAMTVIRIDSGEVQIYWGSESGSDGRTYTLTPWIADSDYDMEVTWQFNSITQATVTVETCSTNCLWQFGQVVTLNKVFGDMNAKTEDASSVPKTGQTPTVPFATPTGSDGNLQKGVAWPTTRFTDNGNGTVTDNLTGLIWMKNANCTDTVGGVDKSAGTLTWADALTWCNNLGNGDCGLTDSSSAGDWRLPNVKELLSLIAYAYSEPALSNDEGTGQWTTGDDSSFTAVSLHTYSSSSSFAGDTPGGFWGVDGAYGQVTVFSKAWFNGYVWPVRSSN